MVLFLVVDGDMRMSSPNDPDPLLFLTVLIVSAPANAQVRSTIRATWLRLSPSSPKLRHFFLVGKRGLSKDILRSLDEEADREEDLLFLHGLEDSFQNLTFKVSQGISLLSKNFPSLYLLKCDDDSFVRLDKIFAELETREREVSGKLSSEKRACWYWGYFDGRAPIQEKGKWKEKNAYLLCDNYLPYALGGGYVISKQCTDFIRNNRHILKPYMNEDVTIGTWLSAISTQRHHDTRFDTEWNSRGCSNRYLIQHKVSQVEMMEKYRNLKAKGRLCTEEWRRRGGYEYNWETPPSQCCHRNSSII